ncbi:hypothetical protein [Litorilituus sediminis]|uniref:DnrO protein n=1 Tax=Litorilituus sediminis TaxID=718192 RepID=A0A4P6P811_9GAMM|nr:hypothetical protein [Litorilituus sediminis]QBG35605.1 hypothetical protein EMK97_07705 [Litorilituus sediminis]
MKPLTPLLAMLMLTLSATCLAYENDHHHHAPQHNPLTQLTLNDGKKWSIDDSLHLGMTQIKREIENNIDAIHHNTFTLAEYEKLAKNINTHLQYIFKHCALPKAADEQLHHLLFSIMQASEQMKSKEQPRQAAVTLIKALEHYPKFFADNNWQALNH